MKAIKLAAMIQKDHRIVLNLPPDTTEGPAEVIVLVPDTLVPGLHDSLTSFLDQLKARSRARSKEQIDRQIQEERNSWER